MAFDMTRYQEICGRLDYADLDLDAAFAYQPLAPDLPAGSTTAARIDRRIDNLPGLDGMGLLDGTLRRHCAG